MNKRPKLSAFTSAKYIYYFYLYHFNFILNWIYTHPIFITHKWHYLYICIFIITICIYAICNWYYIHKLFIIPKKINPSKIVIQSKVWMLLILFVNKRHLYSNINFQYSITKIVHIAYTHHRLNCVLPIFIC